MNEVPFSGINIARPYALKINQASFLISYSLDQVEVHISQQDTCIMLSCTCVDAASFCIHEKIALDALIKQDDLRAFFQPKAYQQQLLSILSKMAYPEPEKTAVYFDLVYHEGKIQIQAKDDNLLVLSQKQLSKAVEAPLADFKALPPILVIRAHRFYKHLQIQLYEAARTKDGRLKNPVQLLSPTSRLWKSKEQKESLFYAALKEFENLSSLSQQHEIRQVIPHLLENPFHYPFFVHDASISEQITASSVKPISVQNKVGDITLSCRLKDDFYQLHLTIQHGKEMIPFSDFELVYDSFLQYKQQLYYISNSEILNFLKIFSPKKEEYLVHIKQFNLFKLNYLNSIEHLINIHFPEIKKAPKSEIAKRQFYSDMEPIIYLEESQEYIHILPVMRYSDFEIPIRSKRQLYSIDEHGRQLAVDRKMEKELDVIGTIIRQHPYFEEQLAETFTYFYLHRDRFMDSHWFLETFEIWRQKGYKIIGFETINKQKLNPFSADIKVEVLSGINWFNTQIQARFGRQAAKLKNIKAALKKQSNLVLLDDGTYGIIPEEWIEKLRRYFAAAAAQEEEFLLFPKTDIYGLEEVFEPHMIDTEVKETLDEIKHKLLYHKELTNNFPPSEFQGELRNYQQIGLQWLLQLDHFNFGGILADDMGLGKSIQIIAFIQALSAASKPSKPHPTQLLVVPTTLLFNWISEFNKFAPNLQILDFQHAQRERHIDHFESYDVIISSYGSLVSDINFLKKYKFSYVFFDESQYLKNPDSLRYKAAAQLQSKGKIALTGTPIENNSMDLYAQMSLVCPGLLGSKKYFKDVYSRPIDAFDDYKRRRSLQEKIKPFILRRTKAEVATELPEKLEMIVYCELGPTQRHIYEQYEREFRDFIDAHTGEEIRKSPMHILKGLMKLRQICNNPALISDDKNRFVSESSKINYLVEQVEEKAIFQKIVIFSQFVSMLDNIKEALQLKGIKSLMLTGKTKNRANIIQEFQENEQERVLLLSLKAGGTGLNLTAASLLFLVDPWWNPAVEAQAIDRIYRIGQQQAVTAVRLISPNTIEEKIMELQKNKQFIASELILSDQLKSQSIFSKETLNQIFTNT